MGYLIFNKLDEHKKKINQRTAINNLLWHESNKNEAFDYWSAAAAGVTGSLAPGCGLWTKVGIALGGTAFTDGPNPIALSGAGVASGLSGAFGKFAPIGVDKIIDDNSVPGLAYDIIGAGDFEFINGFVKDGLNSLPKDEKGNEK